jgi:hypothetical protein
VTQPPKSEQPHWPADQCGCGEALHYSQPALREMMEGIVQRRGPLVLQHVGDGEAYWIPRHFIVLHVVDVGTDVRALASRFGFPKYDGPLRSW